ncbi:MAG TPA: MFS transporter [Edaphobacter sp.]|jgi:ACS family tartrate transporter-like MFS transporter|nr:MFS transporter [Edaphobacter sp.]
MGDTATTASSLLEERAIRKITWRLIPFLMLLYLVAFLDRINVGFAALTMNRDIGLTSQMFGLGSGIFFVGYFVFEVPSTVILHKVGARFWIGRVMITWGLVSIAMAFTRGPISFYVLRFLLGLAEAGFFPGIILYLSYWFPSNHRSAVTAMFMAAAPAAGFIGSPISGALMQLNGLLGLHGWQWLFLVEGFPALVLGFITFRFLTDRPAVATWLTEDERDWLSSTIEREESSIKDPRSHNVWRALADWKVLALSLAYFGTSAGLYTIGFWAPLIVKRLGFSVFNVGLLVAIPNLIAIIGMILWSRNSDRTGERYWHAAIACLIAAAGMALAARAGSSAFLAIAGLSLTAFGVSAAKPPLWCIPTTFFAGTAAAASIGLINSLGTLGGFVGPYMIGSANGTTGNFTRGLYLVGGTLIVSAVTIILMRVSLREAILTKP